MISRPSLLACLLLVLSAVQAVKFQLPAERNPKPSKWSTTASIVCLTDVLRMVRSICAIYDFSWKHND